MSMAMSIRTITLIAIPIATGLARNMLTLIAMITTTSMMTLPIMMVVGANETSMLSAARQTAQRCREQGHVCELLIVQGIGHQWAGRRNLQMWRFLEKHRLNQ